MRGLEAMKEATGLKRFNFFYMIRTPLGGLSSLIFFFAGIGNGEALGVISGVLAAIQFLCYVYMFLNYRKHKFFKIYPTRLLYVTLCSLWLECVVGFLAIFPNVLWLIFFTVFAILNHIYFWRRKALCF